MRRYFILFLVLSVFLVLPNAYSQDNVSSTSRVSYSIDDENCNMCHKYPGLSRVDENGYVRVFYINYEEYAHAQHRVVKCSGCHTDIKEIPHKEAKRVDCSVECHVKYPGTEKPFSHSAVIKDLEKSIHNPKNPFVRNRDAKDDFPICTDCHMNSLKKISIKNKRVLSKCMTCHNDEKFVDYALLHVLSRQSPEEHNADIVKTCTNCHSNDQMAKRHQIKNAGMTYMETFHGKAVEFGLQNAPSCLDCHLKKGGSSHAIYSYKEPISSVYERNRYQACEDDRCHKNVSPNLGKMRMHVIVDKTLYPAEYYTALFFTILTLGVYIFLAVLMILELIREMFPGLSLIKKEKEDTHHE